jgi:hypothetical protein
MNHSLRHQVVSPWVVLSLASILLHSNFLAAQPQKSGSDPKEAAELPSDQQLLKLHRAFIIGAEKLALEYERDKDLNKANVVYEEILKLYPQHPMARTKIQMILEANADVKVLSISGDAGWQDTGINVIKGKPVRIRANGTWTFRLNINLGPEGMLDPMELREFNLGSLIGAIGTPEDMELEAFAIGKDKSLIPKKSGRLFLRMYDISPDDNDGEIKVEIRGSFVRRSTKFR